jgi:hypothetical protein
VNHAAANPKMFFSSPLNHHIPSQLYQNFTGKYRAFRELQAMRKAGQSETARRDGLNDQVQNPNPKRHLTSSSGPNVKMLETTSKLYLKTRMRVTAKKNEIFVDVPSIPITRKALLYDELDTRNRYTHNAFQTPIRSCRSLYCASREAKALKSAGSAP